MATYYIDPNHSAASNANAGTARALPWVDQTNVNTGWPGSPGDDIQIAHGAVLEYVAGDEAVIELPDGVDLRPIANEYGPMPVLDGMDVHVWEAAAESERGIGVYINATSDHTIEGISIRRSPYGIFLNTGTSDDIIIQDCFIQNMRSIQRGLGGRTGTGVWAQNGGARGIMRRLTITGTAADGITTIGSGDWVISYCYLRLTGIDGQSVGIVPGDGIAMHSTNTGIVEHCVIEGEALGKGLSAATAGDVIFRSNYIRGRMVFGISCPNADGGRLFAVNNVIDMLPRIAAGTEATPAASYGVTNEEPTTLSELHAFLVNNTIINRGTTSDSTCVYWQGATYTTHPGISQHFFTRNNILYCIDAEDSRAIWFADLPKYPVANHNYDAFKDGHAGRFGYTSVALSNTHVGQSRKTFLEYRQTAGYETQQVLTGATLDAIVATHRITDSANGFLKASGWGIRRTVAVQGFVGAIADGYYEISDIDASGGWIELANTPMSGSDNNDGTVTLGYRYRYDPGEQEGVFTLTDSHFTDINGVDPDSLRPLSTAPVVAAGTGEHADQRHGDALGIVTNAAQPTIGALEPVTAFDNSDNFTKVDGGWATTQTGQAISMPQTTDHTVVMYVSDAPLSWIAGKFTFKVGASGGAPSITITTQDSNARMQVFGKRLAIHLTTADTAAITSAWVWELVHESVIHGQRLIATGTISASTRTLS